MPARLSVITDFVSYFLVFPTCYIILRSAWLSIGKTQSAWVNSLFKESILLYGDVTTS